MRKVFVLFAVGLLSLTATAQQSVLEGTWVQLDANGFPTTNVKVFMPDGKELGLSYNSDYTNSSVWFMSNYKVLSDTSYVDHSFYHSAIAYQRDYFFTYHMENDSLLVTSYVDFRANGLGFIMTERWKKTDKPMPVYTNEEWQALHQKSLAEFDRLPREGQTIEQYANELYDKAQGYQKDKKLDHANEALLIRAELDTANLDWQRNAFEFYLENKAPTTMAEKIGNRIVRLSEASATAPSDTILLNALRMQAYMYTFRGNDFMEKVRSIIGKVIEAETAAGQQPCKIYGHDYFLYAMTYLPQGDFATIYDYTSKAIDIFEKASDVSSAQKSEAYNMQAISLMNMNRRQEAKDIILNKAVPACVDEQGKPLPKVDRELYLFAHECYKQMLNDDPKNKKLLKEYQQFMSDKLLCAVFAATNKEYNLWGEYIILELGSWTLEKPTAISNPTHYLLQKDGQYVEVDTEDAEKLGGEMFTKTVDAATKQNIIKQWKAYKKNKK